MVYLTFYFSQIFCEKIMNEKTVLNNTMPFDKMFCLCMFLILLDTEYDVLIPIAKKMDIVVYSRQLIITIVS